MPSQLRQTVAGDQWRLFRRFAASTRRDQARSQPDVANPMSPESIKRSAPPQIAGGQVAKDRHATSFKSAWVTFVSVGVCLYCPFLSTLTAMVFDSLLVSHRHSFIGLARFFLVAPVFPWLVRPVSVAPSIDNQSFAMGLSLIVLLLAALTHLGRQSAGRRVIACAVALSIGVVMATCLSIALGLQSAVNVCGPGHGSSAATGTLSGRSVRSPKSLLRSTTSGGWPNRLRQRLIVPSTAGCRRSARASLCLPGKLTRSTPSRDAKRDRDQGRLGAPSQCPQRLGPCRAHSWRSKWPTARPDGDRERVRLWVGPEGSPPALEEKDDDDDVADDKCNQSQESRPKSLVPVQVEPSDRFGLQPQGVVMKTSIAGFSKLLVACDFSESSASALTQTFLDR